MHAGDQSLVTIDPDALQSIKVHASIPCSIHRSTCVGACV
jgi:hypothetical protein